MSKGSVEGRLFEVYGYFKAEKSIEAFGAGDIL